MHFDKIWSHERLVREHLGQQIFEGIAVRGPFLILMCLPELELLAEGNVAVKLVMFGGRMERVYTRAELEKDHSKGEQIGHDWLVGVA